MYIKKKLEWPFLNILINIDENFFDAGLRRLGRTQPDDVLEDKEKDERPQQHQCDVIKIFLIRGKYDLIINLGGEGEWVLTSEIFAFDCS